MDNDGNKVVWTVVIISAIAIIGLMFINFMPSQTANIKTAIGNELSSFGNGTKSDSSSSKSSSSSSSSSSHTAVGTNLFSQSTATAGYVNGGNGTVNSASSTNNEIVSDYISVRASSNYTFQMWGTTPSGAYYWYGIGLYDSDKKFISRLAANGKPQTSATEEHVSKTLTTTSTTAYVRVSFRKYNNYKVKLEKGSKATPWVP